MNQIETSQHVKLNYEVAGVGERILAFFLDGFFIAIYYLVVFWIWSYAFVSEAGEPNSESFWIFMVLVLPVLLYHLVIEVLWKGYSLGKKIVGIRVVKIDGTRANLSGYLLRWLFRIVEITMTSGVLAFVTILLNGKGQRLGDIVGKTCVIKERKKIKLESTLFAEIEEEYEPVFSQVVELGDEHISIIKEVLESKRKYDYDTWFLMLQRTRKKIEGRLGITRADMNAEQFLETVIKDYNAIHGVARKI